MPTDANTFSDVRTGIRAQVQHLRAYADPNVTESTLHNPCVDIRFGYVSKGCAQLVELLGGIRNGKVMWASDPLYGAKLTSMIQTMKGF